MAQIQEMENNMKNHNRLTIKRVTPGYWRATLSNAPINLYDPELFADAQHLTLHGDRGTLPRAAPGDRQRAYHPV
jgi:hypothetical protein